MCGRDDLTGQQRARVRGRTYPLAGSSTLNRMELGSPDTAGSHRYRKIAADKDKLDALLVDLFLDMHRKPRRKIVIDLDATDDPVHGKQEGAQYHGYYRHYCFLPLYITCGDHVLGVRLRPSRIDASKGALEELERVVGRIRERWPEVEITVRGDSGFCRDRLMAWCEEHGARYVFGMARNPRLQRMIEEELEASKAECRDSGEASRRYRELRYRTLASWSCERRVAGRAEWLPGPRGSNPRFVVSNIADDDIEARALYGDLYCARGDMENRIKEQQLELFADRTPGARDAGQPAAGILLGLRRCSDADHPHVRTERRRAGEGSGRDDPHSAAQDRRLHQGDHAQDLGLALLGIPMAQTLQAGRPQARGRRRTAVTPSTRVTPPRLPPSASDGFTPAGVVPGGTLCSPGSHTYVLKKAPHRIQFAACRTRRRQNAA